MRTWSITLTVFQKILHEVTVLCAHSDTSTKPSASLLTLKDKGLQSRNLEHLPPLETVRGQSRPKNHRKQARVSEVESRSKKSPSLDGVHEILGVTKDIETDRLKQTILYALRSPQPAIDQD